MDRLITSSRILLMFAVVSASVACTAGSEVDKYFNDIKALDAATDAEVEWSSLADEVSSRDYRNVPRAQLLEIIERQLAAARKAHEKQREALATLMRVIPPEQCRGANTVTIESLQLSERGYLELISYLSSALGSGYVNDDARIRGNNLLNESDLVMQRGLDAVLECN